MLLPLLLGAALRAAAVTYFTHIHYNYPDENLYWELGQRLLDGQGISLDHPEFGGYVRPNEPTAYFGAVFPPIVSVLRVVSNHNLLIARLILGEFSWFATALAMFGYARRHLHPLGVSLLLFALALFPNLHFIGSFVMTENILIPCACLALFMGDQLARAAKPTGIALFGWSLLYGIIHLIKMNLFLFQPIQFLVDTRKLPWHRKLTTAAIAFAITGMALFPWALRNHEIFGRWTLETKSGFNLWLMNNPNHVKPIFQEDFTAQPPMPSFDGLNEQQRDDGCKALFKQFAFGHPIKVIQLCISRFAIAFRFTPYSLNLPPKIGIIYGSSNALVYALALTGLFQCLRRKIFLDAVSLILYTVVITALTNASFRHRSYADPAMLMLAVVGFMTFASSLGLYSAKPLVCQTETAP